MTNVRLKGSWFWVCYFVQLRGAEIEYYKLF